MLCDLKCGLPPRALLARRESLEDDAAIATRSSGYFFKPSCRFVSTFLKDTGDPD
jgi:hypothetical protein